MPKQNSGDIATYAKSGITNKTYKNIRRVTYVQNIPSEIMTKSAIAKIDRQVNEKNLMIQHCNDLVN